MRRRGDIVTIALQGDFGKPRPALIVQSDLFNMTHPTITVVPLTSELRNAIHFRITVEPSAENGLHTISQIMVDKPLTYRVEKLGKRIGHLGEESMLRVNRALAIWMGLA